jgi:hypothetical protein
MQQWLNLIPIADAFLSLAAAMTNLATAILSRPGTPRDRADSDAAS